MSTTGLFDMGTGQAIYPDGLGQEIARQLQAQGVRIVCEGPRTLLVEWRRESEAYCGFWLISDNGGELSVWQPNMPTVYEGIAALLAPGDPWYSARDWATMLVVRILARMRGEAIDWAWRP